MIGVFLYNRENIFIGKCMFLSGLLPRPMTAEDDQKLLEHGIGFTNIVERTTKGTANLTRREIEEGIYLYWSKIRHVTTQGDHIGS